MPPPQLPAAHGAVQCQHPWPRFENTGLLCHLAARCTCLGRRCLQDTVLFNASILHNVAYGRPGASLADIKAAARASKLDAAIARMPAGGGPSPPACQVALAF